MEQQVMACPLTRGEKILVGLDGSACSDKALDQAISMAKICNSSLFAISVVDMYPETLAIAPGVEEKMSKKAREIVEKAEAKAAKENISCETIVRTGAQPHELIVKEAKARGIDLIVLGITGKTGLKRLMIGSVAQRVVIHAPCAVLLTPA